MYIYVSMHAYMCQYKEVPHDIGSTHPAQPNPPQPLPKSYKKDTHTYKHMSSNTHSPKANFPPSTPIEPVSVPGDATIVVAGADM